MKKLTKPNILLVEDDANLSMVLQDYLEMLNYDITLCRNGKEGLDAFMKGSFRSLYPGYHDAGDGWLHLSRRDQENQ